MDNNFENRLQAIEYELSQVAESEYLDELRKKFTADENIGVVVNILTPKNIVFKTRSLLSQILNRLELTYQDRLDLEKYIVYGGGDNIEYIKQTLAIWVEWKDKIFDIIKDAPEEFDTLIEIFNYIEQHIIESNKKLENIPFEKVDAYNSAVLKGENNQATNDSEVAIGRYNKSNENTRFSIGIGTSNINRKNAYEIMDDGRHYIYGIGGYDGTNSVIPNAQGIIAKSVQELINDNFGGIIIVEHSDTLSKNYVIDVYNKISDAIRTGKMYTIYVDNKTDNTIYGNVQVCAIGSNNVHLSHTIMYPDGSVYIHRHTYHANGQYEFVKGTYNLKKISELETKLNEITEQE